GLPGAGEIAPGDLEMTRSSFVPRHLLVVVGMALLPLSLRAGDEVKPFLDVTEAMGLKGNNGGVAAWGDFDNDGWVDVCIGGEVWRNEEGQRFTKVATVGGPAIWGGTSTTTATLTCSAGPTA